MFIDISLFSFRFSFVIDSICCLSSCSRLLFTAEDSFSIDVTYIFSIFLIVISWKAIRVSLKYSFIVLLSYLLHIFGSTTRKLTCEVCITMPNLFCTKLIETGSMAECHLLSDVSCLDLVLSENTPKQTVERNICFVFKFSILNDTFSFYLSFWLFFWNKS
jgi:hypothetical protein